MVRALARREKLFKNRLLGEEKRRAGDILFCSSIFHRTISMRIIRVDYRPSIKAKDPFANFSSERPPPPYRIRWWEKTEDQWDSCATRKKKKGGQGKGREDSGWGELWINWQPAEPRSLLGAFWHVYVYRSYRKWMAVFFLLRLARIFFFPPLAGASIFFPLTQKMFL